MRVWNGEYTAPKDERRGLPCAFDVLKEAKEPMVWLKLYAHGSHPDVLATKEDPNHYPHTHTGHELDEGLMIPASVLERLVEIEKWGWEPQVAMDEAEDKPKVPAQDWLWLGSDPIYFTNEDMAQNPTRSQFRALLSAKLQMAGDRLMEMWEERHGGKEEANGA